MSGPPSGRYIISPAFLLQPSPGVGTEFLIGGTEKPVVFDPKLQVWNVDEFEPGKYRITQDGWFSEDEAGNVVVKVNTPPGQVWLIRQFAENIHVIELDSPIIPRLFWTLRSAEPKSKVTISLPEETFSFQQWVFLPAPPEE
ncbi:hypothetical protein BS17DRAFT_779089 [Gyrodon lividus]|nr:hypothetical protein BS17DRAFT_779089 [Gyrodon lividus]